MKGILVLFTFIATVLFGLVTVDRLLGTAPVAKATDEASPAAVPELAANPDVHVAASLPVTAPIYGVPFHYSRIFTRNGKPVQAACNLRFSLWDSMIDGQMRGKPYIRHLNVQNGVVSFDVPLADSYQADSRWLQVEARCGKERIYSVFEARFLVQPEVYAMIVK